MRNNNRNKGFTLIELLAVIVILAVIALISTPLITDTIENSRKNTAIQSAISYMNTVEFELSQALLQDQNMKIKNGNYEAKVDGIYQDSDSFLFTYKGMKVLGTMEMKENSVQKGTFKVGNYTITCILKDCSGRHSSSEVAGTGLEPPVIKDGLIPVTYDASGNTVKANTNNSWYDYDKQQWANAVAVTSSSRSNYQSVSAGTKINEADILAYYVWIPRYKYQLWNVNGVSNEQEINIQFELTTTPKSNGTQNGEWLTHPAFTFGSQEVAGIWFGKFELTGTQANPTVKPNQFSLTNLNNQALFNSIKSMNSDAYGLSSYDSHMLKNMEWGAAAYLTQSKYGIGNNEVWINNVNTGTGTTTGTQWGPSITGCSGTSASAGVKNNMTACEAGRDYKNAGTKASTTNNIYGIYDMSGGAWEKAMASVVNEDGTFIASSSGFTTKPDSKYYEEYKLPSGDYNFSTGKLGDGTKEMRKSTGTVANGWLNDYGYFPVVNLPWFYRGGYAIDTSSAGLFYVFRATGEAVSSRGSRAVLVP